MTALLPTLPGFTHGIIGFHGVTVTVQCDRCGDTRTDAPIHAVGWACFPKGHQKYGQIGRWESGERLCPDCRRACGCEGCKETLR